MRNDLSNYIIYLRGKGKIILRIKAYSLEDAFQRVGLKPHRKDLVVNVYGTKYRYDGMDFEVVS